MHAHPCSALNPAATGSQPCCWGSCLSLSPCFALWLRHAWLSHLLLAPHTAVGRAWRAATREERWATMYERQLAVVPFVLALAIGVGILQHHIIPKPATQPGPAKAPAPHPGHEGAAPAAAAAAGGTGARAGAADTGSAAQPSAGQAPAAAPGSGLTTGASPTAAREAACRLSGKVAGCGCDFAGVEDLVHTHLLPVLDSLVDTPFFRYFKVGAGASGWGLGQVQPSQVQPRGLRLHLA
jgi:hypothetical protein